MGKASSLISLLCMLLLAQPLAAHPAHDSFTEIDWNPEGNALEIAMRILPEVLESALAMQTTHGKKIPLENSAASEPLVEAYLREHFEVRNQHSELMPLTLVTMDIDYAESWLYFTIQASAKDSLTLRNTVLLEVESQQINRVQRLWQFADDIQLYTQTKRERQLWQGQ